MKIDLKHFVILNETLETGLELKKFFEEELGLPNRGDKRFTSHNSNPESFLYYYGVSRFNEDVDNYSEELVRSYKLPIITLEKAREMLLTKLSPNSYDIY